MPSATAPRAVTRSAISSRCSSTDEAISSNNLSSEKKRGPRTQPSLRFDDLDKFRVPLPTPEEQATIAAYLDAETAKLDALVGKVEAAVERLQEYRTALITAAVTGKIDVRAIDR